LHGLGLITHKTSMVNEWEAQNILTSSITKVFWAYLLWTVTTDTLIHKAWD